MSDRKRKSVDEDAMTPFERHARALRHALTTQLRDQPLPPLTEETALIVLGEERLRLKEIEERCSLTKGLQLVCLGANDLMQMGFPAIDDMESYMCTHITQLDSRNITKICIGEQSSAAIGRGAVYTWGDDGTIGRKVPKVRDEDGDMVTDVTDASKPRQIRLTTISGEKKDDLVVDIVGGGNHFVLLTTDGLVFMYGCFRDSKSNNFYNEQPNGNIMGTTEEPCTLPVHVHQLSKIVKIAAGGSMCAAVDTKGQIYTWGIGECGQLGRSEDMGSKDKNGEYCIMAPSYTDDNGDVDLERIRKHYLTPKVPKWSHGAPNKIVINVACGDNHCLVTARESLQDGRLSVYSAGLNKDGQLGHGDELSRHEFTRIEYFEGKNIAYVSAGGDVSFFLDITNTILYTCGTNNEGQLGRSDAGTPNDSVPGIVKFPASKVEHSQVPVILQIEAGYKHALVLTMSSCGTERRVYTWGWSDGRNGYRLDTDEKIKGILYKPTLLGVCDEINAKMHVHQVSAGGTVSGFLGEIYDRADENASQH